MLAQSRPLLARKMRGGPNKTETRRRVIALVSITAEATQAEIAEAVTEFSAMPQTFSRAALVEASDMKV
jgi:hypothetical protein